MSPASHYASASGNQVEDQDHHGHNQQKVDQAAADMKAESQLRRKPVRVAGRIGQCALQSGLAGRCVLRR
jgi:hypothetical protein